MSNSLTIATYSDDLVGHTWDGISAQVGTPKMGFTVTLPDGAKLPIVVEYMPDSHSDGWEFSVELPDGSKVQACDLWELEGREQNDAT